MKQLGKGKVESHPEIEHEDVQKLYQSTDVRTSEGLQEKVWFDIVFRISRRGRENVRQMTKTSFAVAVDVTGKKFVFKWKMSKTKTTMRMITVLTQQEKEECMLSIITHYVQYKRSKFTSLNLNPACEKKLKENYESWYLKTSLGEKP